MILPNGQFGNAELQGLYDSFTAQGEISALDALIVGATIEDIDLADLESYIDETSNMTLIELYERLQCGARNHMRGFMKGIEKEGGTYEPQYISVQYFDEIMAGENAHCH